MQRRSIWMLIWFIPFLTGTAMGQNLIPNGSFETYRNCPHLDNLLKEAIPWYNPNKATPDFYHECFQTGQMALPPRTGQGLGRLFFDQGWAEYFGTRLTKPLNANECYYFEMYVATDTPNKYQTETIGAFFSAQPITAPTSTERFAAGPQVLDDRDKILSLRWKRISGFIKARGGEEYVTIGNFYKDPPFLGFYYLFVDDISLVAVNLDLGKDTTLCGRKSTLLLNAKTPGAANYLWNTGSRDSTLLVARPGKYSVTVTTACKTLQDSITIDYALDFDLGKDTTLCRGETLILKVPPDVAAAYQWQDGSAKNTYTVSQAGQYTVKVTQAPCVVKDSIQVKYTLPPKLDLGPDQQLCAAESFTIKPIMANGNFTWLDQYPDIDRTVTSYGVFTASVKNDCAIITDSIVIDYSGCGCVLYTPDLFTPNGDGKNDVFLTFGCGDIKITSLSIFNRWGEIVFQTSKVPFQWDGYYKGELSPVGVYAWHIEYQLTERNKVTVNRQQGTLNLIR